VEKELLATADRTVADLVLSVEYFKDAAICDWERKLPLFGGEPLIEVAVFKVGQRLNEREHCDQLVRVREVVDDAVDTTDLHLPVAVLGKVPVRRANAKELVSPRLGNGGVKLLKRTLAREVRFQDGIRIDLVGRFVAEIATNGSHVSFVGPNVRHNRLARPYRASPC